MRKKALDVDQLARVVAKNTGHSIRASRENVWAVLDAIAQTVAAGGAFTATNFGTFDAPERPERMARNPQTGERRLVPAGRFPRFKPTGRFRRMVREGDTDVTTIRKPVNGRHA